MAAVVGRLVADTEELPAVGRPVAGVGMGAAGMIDRRRGVVMPASNLKWKDVPLRDLVVEQPGAVTSTAFHLTKWFSCDML